MAILNIKEEEKPKEIRKIAACYKDEISHYSNKNFKLFT